MVGVVSAQAPTAYYVGFQIQNLSATETATVGVSYYKQDGTGASTDSDYQQTISIPAGKSKTIICSLNSDLSADILAPAPAVRGAASFVGSVIISSDQEVVAIANEAASVNSPYGSASYDGVASEDLASTLYAPLIAKLGQPDTTINVQNPNSTAVDVTVEYVAGSMGTDYTAPTLNLPGYGSAIIEVPNNALVGGTFLGSAKITSSGGDIAAVVDAIFAVNTPSAARYNARQSYNTFDGGATKVVAPLIQKNDNGVWYTGLQVMNLGPGSADVKVSYSGLQGSGQVPDTPVSGIAEPNFTLQVNESKTILSEFGGPLDSQALASYGSFRGAATVEVVGGTGMVAAIVSVAGESKADVAYYSAFDPAAATQTVNVPLIQKYLGTAGANGWSTGVQVANLGAATTTVTGTFNVTCNGTPETIVDTVNINQDSSETFLQLNGWAIGALGTRDGCLGSAVFTADEPIVAIVQQSYFGAGNPFTGDVLLAFEAFNK
jgi:hypothetical protein